MTVTAVHEADLEPSQVGEQTYVTRRRPTRVDAAALLSLMVVLIALIPAHLIVPGMTDLGRPGLIVGFMLFCMWVLVRFSSHLVLVGPQPIRWAVLTVLVSALVSYAAGFLRGLTSMEANGADRMVLFYCVFVGVILTAADGLPNWLRLRRLLTVLVVCGALMAVLALIQYILAIDITQYMTIPGLQAKGWSPGFEARGGGIRVAATTSHYIELAAVLATILPFAIHFGFYSDRLWSRRLSILAALLLGAGISTTISRTGIFAIGLMLVVLIPVWTWRMRYNLLMVSLGMVAALAVVSPGLVRTLYRLFDSPESNPSITARADRYPLVFRYFAEHPWLGRGTGTWISPQYQILDNQWLATLMSNGVIGVAALLALHVTGIVLAFLALRRSTNAQDRHLCAALISAQVIAIGVAGTFDSLSFLTYATLLSLTIGLCGTVWRLTHPARIVRTSTTQWFLN